MTDYSGEILRLLCSSQADNIKLAELLAQSQGLDIEKIIEKAGYNDLCIVAPTDFLRKTITGQGNDIKKLPSMLPACAEILYLNENRLKELILPPMPNLKHLDCGQNKITKIANLPPTLEEFYCEDNKLTELPTLPKKLKNLVCSGNLLTELPPLPLTLETLECNYNKLTHLPDLSPNKKVLSELYCEHNQLAELPFMDESFELNDLHCGYNKISHLPVVLPANLWSLNCQYNHIQTIPELPENLNYLDCFSNPIKKLPFVSEKVVLSASKKLLKDFPKNKNPYLK